ncbi:MAG: carboxymuconolactone decarboxylase family protein [Candidatus Binatia bacterium]
MTDSVVAALHDYENSPEFTLREKLALRFAEYMGIDHHQIDDRFFQELRQEFNAAEIIELGMMIGLFIGYGRLLAVLDLEK